MPDTKPVYIISDAPEKKSVEFGFDAYARTISDLIANKNNRTPLVIGIYGSWGSGKTTLMKAVKQNLESEDYSDKEVFRKCKTVWFQAWKYRDEEAILAALIDEIFKSMRKGNFFESISSDIEKLITKIKPFKVFGKAFEKVSGIDFTDYFSEMAYKSKLGFYATFQEFFDRLLWTYTNLRPKVTSEEQPNDQKGALAIFIDDLDRCPKHRIVSVLEAIKLFMDKKGCVFVIGAANDIIEKALSQEYGEVDAARFMDKVVQVTFNLPKIPEDDFKSFMETISPRMSQAISAHLPMLMPAMQNNPRQFKRFLNNLSLQAGILENKQIETQIETLVYWSIFEYIYPALSDDIKDNPKILALLRDNIANIQKSIGERSLREITDEDLKDCPRSLHQHIKDHTLARILGNFSGDEEAVRQLIFLSGIIEKPQEERIKIEKQVDFGFEDMVEVPAGQFIYGEGEQQKNEIIKEPYLIDVYPVTNDQYKRFVKAGGYQNDQYWTPEAVKWRYSETITAPLYWYDPQWNKSGHPVVGVSYYEAEAYAKWAQKRLPTGIEWERAAQGTDGREYPWVGGFDKEKCNTAESGVGATTRVTRYPNGTSPVGCYDMAGNVWEWTVSDYSRDTKVLRGGSWALGQDYARCAYRYGVNPGSGSTDIGFRCVRTLK